MESAIRRHCPDDLKLIETLRGGAEGLVRVELHLERLRRSCELLGVPFHIRDVRAALAQVPTSGVRRVRLTIDLRGKVTCSAHEISAHQGMWQVAIHETPVASNDPWLQVKTTQRAFYDQARAALPDHLQEWLFVNENGAVCEGTITNIFVPDGDQLLTPPCSCGALPGVLRESLLQSGRARQAHISVDDLRDVKSFFVGNSLRGLITASLVG
ncbi:4-amino-4-deoxychorismate lyase [Rhodobacteraceae bacterium]|nr:4-amino-4-deoxychorismate lyase [Paracoccaceae bacterium]